VNILDRRRTRPLRSRSDSCKLRRGDLDGREGRHGSELELEVCRRGENGKLERSFKREKGMEKGYKRLRRRERGKWKSDGLGRSARRIAELDCCDFVRDLRTPGVYLR
jgi:hypothetical protein